MVSQPVGSAFDRLLGLQSFEAMGTGANSCLMNQVPGLKGEELYGSNDYDTTI